MKIKTFRGTITIFIVCIAAGLGIGWMNVQHQAAPEVTHIEPSDQTGTSMATVVDDVSLAHTSLFLPVDGEGNLVGPGDLEQQVDQALANIETALAEVDAGLSDLVKLHVYVTNDQARDQVLDQLGQVFPDGARPAVAFVAGNLPRSDALVAMDAVAVTPQSHDDVASYHSDALSGPADQGHVGILPPGGKVYLSGQAASGDLLEGTRGTMEGLHATLAYLGLSAEDVVQIKAFVNPVTSADSLEAQIAEFYRDKPAPPVVSAEWTHGSLPTEIELVASRDVSPEAERPDNPVSYITPPGMSAIPTFARVTEVHSGGLMYVSGLYGKSGQDAEAQVRSIFDTLERLTSKAGSDFDNLAKATYYFSTDEASTALNEVRREFYDPQRPPASSKIAVRSVGKPGTTVTFDMIGAITE